MSREPPRPGEAFLRCGFPGPSIVRKRDKCLARQVFYAPKSFSLRLAGKRVRQEYLLVEAVPVSTQVVCVTGLKDKYDCRAGDTFNSTANMDSARSVALDNDRGSSVRGARNATAVAHSIKRRKARRYTHRRGSFGFLLKCANQKRLQRVGDKGDQSASAKHNRQRERQKDGADGHRRASRHLPGQFTS